MTDSLIECLLWFAALGCGMLAGLYFAFSTFIMKALGRMEQGPGILAMNSINSTILQSLFMPFFFGTTLASVLLAGIAAVMWGDPGTATMLAGGLVYFTGMFLCTMFCNVPLNNQLAAVDSSSPESTPVWRRYLRLWTLWNHVRTLSSAGATVLYIAALTAR
jgi:uncharacterized membrane protein